MELLGDHAFCVARCAVGAARDVDGLVPSAAVTETWSSEAPRVAVEMPTTGEPS
jgi:hypothetical protein